MQIAVGGCLAQKDKNVILEKAPWVDVVFGTHNMGSLPDAARARAPQRRGAARDPRVARGLPLDAADPARVHPQRLGVDLRRLQQHLHVLHRARRCAARRRTAGPATSSPRSRRSSTTAPSRSRCSARTSTPTASSSATGSRSASCCAPRARSTVSSAIRFTSPHPAAFTDDVIDAMAETPNVMPQLHMPLQSGSDRILKAMRRSYRSEKFLGILDRVRANASRTPRSRPTSSSASPARPRRTSRRPCASSSRRASPRRSRSSTRSARARPRRPCPTRCRRRSCRSATSDSSRCRTASRARRTQKLVGTDGRGARRRRRGPPRRARRTACPVAPRTTASCTSTCPRAAPMPAPRRRRQRRRHPSHPALPDRRARRATLLPVRRTRAGDAWDRAEAESCAVPARAGAAGAATAAPSNLGLPDPARAGA